MTRRAPVLAVLPVAWVLAAPGAALAAPPPAEAGHESVWPSLGPTTDEHAQHGEAEHEAVTSPDHDDHGDTHGVPVPEPDRPVGLVLGVFGGLNGAVVLSAALVRRRERAARLQRQAERSRRRAVPAGGAS